MFVGYWKIVAQKLHYRTNTFIFFCFWHSFNVLGLAIGYDLFGRYFNIIFSLCCVYI